MLSKVKHKLSTPTKVVGVSIELLSKDDCKVSYVLLEKKKQRIELTSSAKDIVDLEQVINTIDKTIPVVLSISGMGVIHKKLQSSDLEIHDALPYILPNSKPDDFFLQKCPTNSDSVFYSIVRKDVLNKWLAFFIEEHITVLDVTLGPFSVNSVLSLISNDGGDLHIGNHTLEFNSTRLLSISPNGQSANSPLNFGESSIEGDLANAYATGFQNISGLPDKVHVASDQLVSVRDEYFHQRIFKIGGWTALIILLVALLSNFLANSHLSQENSILEESYITDSLLLAESDLLEIEVANKENFLKKAGWLSTSRSSYYMDQLAQEVPKDVLLGKLSFQPIDKMLSREQRKTVYEVNKIYVEGFTKHGTSLNPWIKKIEKEQWTKRVEVIGYEYDSMTKLTTFEISIEF